MRQGVGLVLALCSSIHRDASPSNPQPQPGPSSHLVIDVTICKHSVEVLDTFLSIPVIVVFQALLYCSHIHWLLDDLVVILQHTVRTGQVSTATSALTDGQPAACTQVRPQAPTSPSQKEPEHGRTLNTRWQPEKRVSSEHHPCADRLPPPILLPLNLGYSVL